MSAVPPKLPPDIAVALQDSNKSLPLTQAYGLPYLLKALGQRLGSVIRKALFHGAFTVPRSLQAAFPATSLRQCLFKLLCAFALVLIKLYNACLQFVNTFFARPENRKIQTQSFIVNIFLILHIFICINQHF